MNDLIVVKQLPIIEEHLRAKKEEIEKMTSEAMSLACTEDTLQSVKSKRADLTAEFAAMEEQRKAVKASIMEPYQRFNEIYKECITAPFEKAISSMGEKITDVEAGIKRKAELEMRSYFAKMCAAEGLDWLTYERLGLKISLTDARQKKHQKLREAVAGFVLGVADDVRSISTMEGAEEILVEYKNLLSLSRATTVVFERHRKIEEEAAAAEARKAAQEAQKAAVAKVEAVYTQNAVKPLQPPTAAPAAQPKGKIYKTSFTARGTRDQLVKLKEFMTKEGIQYE